MKNISQRDAFWDRIYELAKEDEDIVLVVADMGAPALDKFRIYLSAQYIDVGIAEQQAVSLAAGLALSGKKPFVYAIAPFVALRCYEHTRVNLASMNLPVTLVGVGAGVSYDDSGPTHHAVDDLSVLRIFPNLRIHNITDSVMARALADISCKLDFPNYVRLDRKILPTIYDENTDFSVGLTVLVPSLDICIVATGNMVHRALEVSESLKKEGISAGVIDIYTLPINEDIFVDKVKDVAHIVTLEEHTLPGGLGSAVCEVLSDHQLLKPVKRIGMDFKTGYCYKYGGRDNIQLLYNLDKESIVKTIMSQLKESYVVKRRLDLLLVNPGNREQLYQKLGNSLSAIEPPIWTGLIATFVRNKGYSVQVLDANAEGLGPVDTAKRIAEIEPVLIAIVVYGQNPSASTMVMPAVSAISKEIKKLTPEQKVLLVGGHVAALPDQTLREEDADYVCDGEGPYTVVELLETLKQEKPQLDKVRGLLYWKDGEVKKNLSAPLVKDLDQEMAGVAWDLLPMELYRAHNWQCFAHIDQRQPYASLYTTLGCPFHCAFCCIQAPFKSGEKVLGYSPKVNTYRRWSPESVINQIDILVNKYGIKNIKFADEIFVLNKKHVLGICDRIIERGYDLNIWAYARVDSWSEEVLKRMKKAGIHWVCLGIESGSSRVRDNVHKGYRPEAVFKAVEAFRKAGIYIIANYLFGLPEDDIESMQETLDLALTLNCEFANFYCAMAYPGSELYEQTVADGLPLPETWAGYSQHAYDTLPLSTKYLSGTQVLQFRDEAFNTYFNNQKYLEMIHKTFGPNVVKHIKEMESHRLERKYLHTCS